MRLKPTEPAPINDLTTEGGRLKSEIDRLGGPTKLGELLGVAPTLFYKYTSGVSRMGRKLEMRLMEVGADVHWIKTGIYGDATGADTALDTLTAELMRDLDMAEQMTEITISRIRNMKATLSKRRRK